MCVPSSIPFPPCRNEQGRRRFRIAAATHTDLSQSRRLLCRHGRRLPTHKRKQTTSRTTTGGQQSRAQGKPGQPWGDYKSRSHLARPRATTRPTHAPSPTTSNDTTHAPSQTTSNDTHARTIAKGAPDVVGKRIARQIQGARPRYWMRGHVEAKERQRRRKRSHRVVLASKG